MGPRISEIGARNYIVEDLASERGLAPLDSVPDYKHENVMPSQSFYVIDKKQASRERRQILGLDGPTNPPKAAVFSPKRPLTRSSHKDIIELDTPPGSLFRKRPRK